MFHIMKYTILFLFLFIFNNGFSQTINDYKYAIVPSSFPFLKVSDQYRLNTLSKKFMEHYGFETYFDNEILPIELVNQKCNSVFVEVLENNTMFMTKVVVILKDCTNKVLFTSIEGKSREKEYSLAYNLAFREAFNSFLSVNYKYNLSERQTNVKPVLSIELQTMRLTAKPIKNGFELFDETSSLVFSILNTSKRDVFVVQKNFVPGILFFKDDTWFLEYYQQGVLISEKYEIKF